MISVNKSTACIADDFGAIIKRKKELNKFSVIVL
jgi:hypothetical protein